MVGANIVVYGAENGLIRCENSFRRVRVWFH